MQITPASILSLAALISATGSAVAALPTYSTYGNQDLATRDFEDDLDFMARNAPEPKKDEKKKEEHHKHAKHGKEHVKMLKSVSKIIDPLLKKEAAHGTERFICQVKTSAGKDEAQFVETKDGKVTHVSHIGKSHDIHAGKHARHHHSHHHRKSSSKHHEVATCVSFSRGTVHKASHTAHKKHHHSKHAHHKHAEKKAHKKAAKKDVDEEDDDEEEEEKKPAHKHHHSKHAKHHKEAEKKSKHHKHADEDEDDDEADKRSFFEEQFYYGY